MKIIITKDDVEIKASRSSGAGGQNVNKVNSKISIKFDIQNTSLVPAEVKRRFQEKYKSRIDNDGFISFSSDVYRSQKLNLEDALNKINEMIESVRVPPKSRIKTKPTKASKVRRVQSKRIRSDVKKMRTEKF